MFSDIITYGLLLFYYTLFLLAVYASSKCSSGEWKDILLGKGEAGILFIRLIAGIFFLGTVTIHIIIKRQVDPGIFTPSWSTDKSLTWILAAVTAAMLAGFMTALKKLSPTATGRFSFPFYLPLSFFLIRTLFLIVYEFFFRGVLLFVMIEDFGTIAAVFINIVLYVLIHWYSNKKERAGSVLMGLLLCSITIYYHSVWPAVSIHLALALSHEFTLFINHRSSLKKLSI